MSEVVFQSDPFTKCKNKSYNCIKVNGFAKHLYINKTKAVYYVKAAIDQNLKNIQIT